MKNNWCWMLQKLNRRILLSTCLFIFLLSARASENQRIVLVDNPIAYDTLWVDFENGVLKLNIDVVNRTSKRNEVHTWVFRDNVYLHPDESQLVDVDEDMNSIRLAKKLLNLHLEVTPSFDNPPEIIITPLLSNDTVYKAVLKYAILSVNWNETAYELTHKKDTLLKTVIYNRGLKRLYARVSLKTDKSDHSWSDTIVINAKSQKEFLFPIPFYQSWIALDTNRVHVELKVENLSISPNKESRTLILNVFPFFVEEHSKSTIGLWLWLVFVVSFIMWYIIKKGGRNLLMNPLDWFKRSKRNRVEPDVNLAKVIVSEIKTSEKLDEQYQEISKEAKSNGGRKTFLRKEIIQRQMLSKYIKDATLNDKLKERGEVDLIKYIGVKFKEADKLQRILSQNPEWTTHNVVKKIEGLVSAQKIEKKVIERSPKAIKITQPKTIAQNEKVQELQFDGFYWNELDKLNNLLADIEHLAWEDIQPLFLLKNKFLNYLGIRENRLEAYMHRLKVVPGLAQGYMDNSELHRFVDLFTDLFNLQSFAHFEPFRNLFVDLDFPFETYQKILEEIRNYWLNAWELQAVIPQLFEDMYDKEWHCDSEDVSKVLAENAIDINRVTRPGLIKDYSSIGIFSKKLSIARRAAVYIER